ncbi:hypothetical protein ACFL5V_03210 [Fibrobacterota bacterium]
MLSCIRTLTALLALAVAGKAETVSISGRVTDGSAGIQWATVSLKAAGLSTLTDSDGNYTLTGSVSNTFGPVTSGGRLHEKPALAGGMLHFSLPESDVRVRIVMYDLQGAHVRDVFEGKLVRGSYSLGVDSQGLSHQCYLFLVEIGDEAYRIKVPAMLMGNFSGHRLVPRDVRITASLAKTAAADSLTVSKGSYVSAARQIDSYEGTQDFTLQADARVTWVSSVRPSGDSRRIAWTSSDGITSDITYLTGGEHNDYKPVTSPDGSKIAFFRVINGMDDQAPEDVSLWKSKICVMNSDGTGFRELTGGEYFDTNPHWTRDGSNRITWSRIANPAGTPDTYSWMYVFRTTPESVPGDEVQLSGVNWEHSYSSLRDGRVFLRRGNTEYFLMTPNPGGPPVYQQISYPLSGMHLHKVSISHDEALISYMKITESDMLATGQFMGSVICYADFDQEAPAITNEVEITAQDWSSITWYTSFSPDDSRLLFAHNGVIVLYDIAAALYAVASTNTEVEYRYPNYLGSVK